MKKEGINGHESQGAGHALGLCGDSGVLHRGRRADLRFFLFLNGLPFFTKYDLGAFLSGTTWKPANNIFGILPMIVGSLYVTGGALLFRRAGRHPRGDLSGALLPGSPAENHRADDWADGGRAVDCLRLLWADDACAAHPRDIRRTRTRAVHPDSIAAAGHHDSADHHPADLRRRQSRAELLL